MNQASNHRGFSQRQNSFKLSYHEAKHEPKFHVLSTTVAQFVKFKMEGLKVYQYPHQNKE